MVERLDKIKIPHMANNVNNVVYTVARGKYDWVKDGIYLRFEIPTIPGFYRFTLFRDFFIVIVIVTMIPIGKKRSTITIEYFR